MKKLKLFKRYSNGADILWWTLGFDMGWSRGLCLGIRHKPGPHRDFPFIHSTLIIHLLVFEIAIHHSSSRISLYDR